MEEQDVPRIKNHRDRFRDQRLVLRMVGLEEDGVVEPAPVELHPVRAGDHLQAAVRLVFPAEGQPDVDEIGAGE